MALTLSPDPLTRFFCCCVGHFPFGLHVVESDGAQNYTYHPHYPAMVVSQGVTVSCLREALAFVVQYPH